MVAMLVAFFIGWFAVHAGSCPRDRVVLAASSTHPVPVAVESDLTSMPTSSHAAVPLRRAPAADETEVCGFGIVKRSELERDDSPVLPDPKAMRARWIDNMRASGDAAVRATGHYLAATLAWKPAPDWWRAHEAACGKSSSCMLQNIRDAKYDDPVVSRETDALVDDAIASGDPKAYAIAVQACGTASPEPTRGRCQLVNLERWSQLDSDNAVPWLHLAGAAEQRGNAAARDEALYHASIASTSDIVAMKMLALADASMPDEVNPYDRLRLVFDLLGLSAGWTLPPLQTITRHCTAESIRDANVRQVCEGLTSTLVDKRGTLIERAVGIRMAERVGWPAARIHALKQERLAFAEVGLGLEENGTDCAALANKQGDLLRFAQLGEVAYLQQRIAETQQTVETLAKRFEDKRLAAAEAEAASAAASAAR